MGVFRGLCVISDETQNEISVYKHVFSEIKKKDFVNQGSNLDGAIIYSICSYCTGANAEVGNGQAAQDTQR